MISIRSCDSLSRTRYGVMPGSRLGTLARSISIPLRAAGRFARRAGQTGRSHILNSRNPRRERVVRDMLRGVTSL